MDRRTFNRNVAGLLISSMNPDGKLSAAAIQPGETDERAAPAFDVSVMLWTVFRDLPFADRLERVAAAGYRNVELVGEYDKWSDDDFERAIRKRKELGITFDTTAGLKHSLCNPAEREDLVRELERTLPTMERLECPSIILLSGNIVPHMSVELHEQSCVEGLKAAARLIEGKQIHGKPLRILLENIDPEENPRYFLTSVARGFEIVKAVNHPQVEFLYDFFHAQIAEGNLIEKLENNIEHVGLVHIADVPGRHMPGTGEINYENIFRKLAQLNYRKIVAMEFLPEGDAVRELRRAREMALGARSATA